MTADDDFTNSGTLDGDNKGYPDDEGGSSLTIAGRLANTGAAPIGNKSASATTTATLSTLVSFDGADGDVPYGNLIADATGDLFGTTYAGGADDDGTVFEIAKTATGYASTPTTLVSFNGSDGAYPQRWSDRRRHGDLFGTTAAAARTATARCSRSPRPPAGYASTPTTLVSFNGTDGADPRLPA